MIRGLIRRIVFRTGRLHGLYLRICRPSGDEYARFLRARNTFHAQGDFCYIMPTTVFTDPKYVEIGNNVQMATCTVLGHDGSVSMLNRACWSDSGRGGSCAPEGQRLHRPQFDHYAECHGRAQRNRGRWSAS